MATASTGILQQYQQPMWGRMDRALRNCFTASSILGAIVLIAIYVVPKPPPVEVTMDDIPDRIARLILEKPTPAPIAKAAPAPAVEPTIETPPQAKPKAPPRRRTSKPRVAQDKGAQGRQKAQQEVSQNLAAVTGDLDKVLNNLSNSLPASETDPKDNKPRRRRRGVRSGGRSSEQLSAVGGVENLSSADVSKSAITSEGISIASISDLEVQDGGGGDVPQAGGSSGGGTRSGSSDYRSNESLLSVVRRYAPGIQFCYDNELKKNPGLRGKLVVNLTVLANGAVSDVIVVDNTLRSPGVTKCVLAQIKGWQFPAIPQGTTSFKTPFVFTPPE